MEETKIELTGLVAYEKVIYHTYNNERKFVHYLQSSFAFRKGNQMCVKKRDDSLIGNLLGLFH